MPCTAWPTAPSSLEDNFLNEEENEAEAFSVLPLPSNITSVKLAPALKPLIFVERELRKGQANDALEGL